MKILPLLLAGLLATSAWADPQLTSWFTANAGQYAQIQPTTGAALVTTWTGQTLPVYSDVEIVASSTSNVYVYASGLASHVMGPWYLNAAKTMIFPNKPTNQKLTMRFPRFPVPASTHTSTPFGPIGFYVNGTAVYNMLDAYSYNAASNTDLMGMGGLGVWNRDADFAEVASFDPNNAHQPGSGQYHAHVNPPALRYQLNDNATFNAATDTYSESTNNLHHSPIIGWATDGYPIYGPYGYSVTNDVTSPVRRMVSGYIRRDGSYGTTNLNTTGRTTLPLWAQIAQGRVTLSPGQYGPSTTKTADMTGSFAIGRYAEDNDYLGDLPPAGAQWDLDRYNGRYCVTPDYPLGTYAYFISITSTGTPAFPYIIGRQYYGNASGGSVTNITGAVTTNFTGGAYSSLTVKALGADTNGDVTLTWSSVQGGTYIVTASEDLNTWSNLTPSVTATSIVTQATDAGAEHAYSNLFYKVKFSSIATYDP